MIEQQLQTAPSGEEKRQLRQKLKMFYEKSLKSGQGAYFSVRNGELAPTPMGRHWLREHLDIAGRLLALTEDEVLLDIGCGEGYYTMSLCNQARLSVGMDVSRAVLDVLRSLRSYNPARLKLVEADVEALPFHDAAVDKVLCSHLLEHVLDDAAVVREAHRVLRPGGVAVFAVPLKFTPQHQLLIRLTNIARAILKPGKKGTPLPAPGQLNTALVGRQGHIRHYSLASFQRMIESQGFRVEETIGVFFHDPRNWLVHRTQRNRLAYALGTRISKRYPQTGAAVVVKASRIEREMGS